jgi:putative transposase
MDILTLFACCSTFVATTSLRHLTLIAQAMLTMTGRVTMLGISCWTEKGGSYRAVNRFFATDVLWLNLLVKFVQTHLFDSSQEYILTSVRRKITN